MAAHFAALGIDGAFAAQNVMTIAAPAMAFGAPLIGWLAGRLGKRNTMLASLLIYGLAGLAGAYLSVAPGAVLNHDMTAGQGFIALAAIIFGKWRPFPAFGACLIFGLLDAIAIRLQGVRVPGVGEVPVQLIQALPYLLTVFLLAGFIGRATAPRAAGVPYEKEH